MKTDDQNQLVARAIRAKDVCDRKVDELIGICRGIMADGSVNQKEAEYLLSWIEANREYAQSYPFSIIYDRVSIMLSDGIFDDEEKKELLEIMVKLTGGEIIGEDTESMSSTLPLCVPAPKIVFKGSSFVFTGVFTTGARKVLEELVKELGGSIHDIVKKDTDYLVIGDIGSKDWSHSSYGRKIEKAVEYRDIKDTGISIVCESHWSKFL
ncbi:MAG: hypothetical protein EOM50_15950 [Erysipelotrichia bacterium]|nr:hypothetical protein [Erysipelotrichia bacterium]